MTTADLRSALAASMCRNAAHARVGHHTNHTKGPVRPVWGITGGITTAVRLPSGPVLSTDPDPARADYMSPLGPRGTS
jgi:hypothetical protein